LPNQFKAAELNGVPFSIILGEDEVAQGKVKIKENGLREGHPEKDGVVVNLEDLVSEVKQRLKRKADLDNMAQKAGGLRVVGGIKEHRLPLSLRSLPSLQNQCRKPRSPRRNHLYRKKPLAPSRPHRCRRGLK
jgi:hypothetical protein